MPHQTVLLARHPIGILASDNVAGTVNGQRCHRAVRIRLTSGSRQGSSAAGWEHRVPEGH